MREYLVGLERGLGERQLELMQSSGGTISAQRAAQEPVRVLFSGPAGGVIGAARAARESGFESIVALDMGGTSTDVAFHSSSTRTTLTETRIAGLPIAVPALDIHTIGTGGGSLVSVDDAGILHVGPESAAADPGPVCYGQGETLTVTDAHVELGHIATGSFASGRIELDRARVHERFEELARRLEVRAHEAAQAVLDVARASMRRAIGVMTMQRGQDPKRLPLVAFGGAGGLHGAALAGSLEMPGALIPACPGVLSAWGMAHADALCDRSRTALGSLAEWTRARRSGALTELLREAAETLEEAGHSPDSIVGETSLDLRYRGQNSSLALADEGASSEELAARFHARHAALYGWSLEENEIELVTLRARARVPLAVPEPRELDPTELPREARLGERTAWFDEALSVPRIARERLQSGNVFEGPALLEEQSGTGIVPPGWTARVLSGGHLWLTLRVNR
jgi:N-methylhydantoinase A